MVKPIFYIYQGMAAEEISTDQGISIRKVPIVVVKDKEDVSTVGLIFKAAAVTKKGLTQYFWDNHCGQDAFVYLSSESDVSEEIARGSDGIETILKIEDRFKRDYLNPNAVHPGKEPREYIMAEGVTPPLGVRFRYTKDDLDSETKETKKVLIVDDDVVLPTMLMRMLPNINAPYDYQFRVASNGAEGAQAIEEYEPDLVFTDLSMAGGNGTLVIRKANEKKKPVILMTTNQPGDKLYDEAVEARPTYILGKPFEVTDLKTAVETAFDPDTDLEGNLE